MTAMLRASVTSFIGREDGLVGLFYSYHLLLRPVLDMVFVDEGPAKNPDLTQLSWSEPPIPKDIEHDAKAKWK
jgi:hypothetical protein